MVQLVDNLLERAFPAIRRKPIVAYPIAVLIFVAAAGASQMVPGWLLPSFPFVPFFVAVLLTTLISGTKPGLLTLCASLAYAWYFFIAPSATYRSETAAILPLAVFFVLAALLIAVVHQLNRKVEGLLNERARSEALLQDSALEELQLEQLNSELRHRLKNIFAVVSGLVSQSARYSQDISAFASALSGRLSAMGTAMDLIATRNFSGASLHELVAGTLKPLVPPGASRIEISGPEAVVPGDVASALGLTLHELGTNAIKYGAWSNERGTVRVGWQLEKLDDDEARLVLNWVEHGGPAVGEPERKGLGTVLIDGGFPAARVERSFSPDGVLCNISAVIKQTTTRRTRRPR